MTDIAQLGFSVDTGDLSKAKASLDALAPSSREAAQASDTVTNSLTKLDIAAGKTADGLRQTKMSIEGVATGARFSGGNFDILTGKMNSNFAAINGNLARLGLAKKPIDDVAQAIKFGSYETLNFTRQLSDIGTTLAMGMNPFMIAVQQGPQLLDILQNKAAATGSTLGAVFRAAGVAIWTALAPILPILLAIAAGVAVVASAFALGTRQINAGNASIIDGLGLTDKQLERVKKSGVETGVTIGDTFFAFFDVVGDRLVSAFDGPLKWLKKAWNDTLDFITTYGLLAIKGIIGAFTGAVYAIRASWSLLPGAIGDIAIMTTNAIISAVEFMINKSIQGLNFLLSFANEAAAKLGLPGLGQISQVSLGQFGNPFAGQAEQARQAIGTGFKQGMADASGAVDRFFGDVGKKARERAKNRILEAAGPGEKDKTGSGGKSDKKTDPFGDLVKGAQTDIANEQARAAAVGLSAEAAATLAEKTKLLNEAHSKGIVLTDAMRAKIDELAAAYGKAKVDADHKIGVDQIMKASEAAMQDLERERGEIGLTGAALLAYRKESEMLAQARQKNIDLTPEEIEAIHQQAEAYGRTRYEIDQLKESLDFAKSVTKGFFTDLIGNIRNGQSVWEAFGNAFLNVLNKIMDRLLDKALDQLINSLFDSIGFGGGFAKGGAFNGQGVIPFAKGGAFTNSVVSSPTLFKFANGGAMGVMGEAGPEAVMPLHRGPDGSLGVRMADSGTGKSGPAAINVSVVNNHTLTGAVSSQDVIDLNKKSAEQTVAEVKRQLQPWLAQYQRDGAVV